MNRTRDLAEGPASRSRTLALRFDVLMLGVLAYAVDRLPLWAALAVGRGVGGVSLFGRRTITRKIEAVFPGRGRRTARAHLAELGVMLCEFLRQPAHPEDLARIEVRGWEHLPAGGVILAGHYGNIELMGFALGRSGRKIAALATRPGDPFLQFIDQRRQASRIRFIYTAVAPGAGTRAFLQARRLVREGYAVAFLADTGDGGNIELEFLGRRTAFDFGGELLARRIHCPVVACVIERTPRGHVLEILPLPSDTPTEAFVRLLEQRIRTKPEQYFWGLPGPVTKTVALSG